MTALLSWAVLLLSAASRNGASSHADLARILDCALNPKPEAIACLRQITGVNEASPTGAAAKRLVSWLEERKSAGRPNDREPLLLYQPSLELSPYSGKPMRGGTYSFKIRVSEKGELTDVRWIGPRTGDAALDRYLEGLARKNIVVPRVVGGRYASSDFLWSVTIDVH